VRWSARLWTRSKFSRNCSTTKRRRETSRSENVEELVSALADFSARAPDAKLEDFLEEVSLVSDLDQADFGRNAVTLMSLHAAKGLEFPVVFITGMEEGIFPLAGAVADRKELEEERRLMYVGMTRAKRKLYLFLGTQPIPPRRGHPFPQIPFSRGDRPESS